jgi:glycosyltransferase involved in cell wall biosynthesis
MKRLLVCPQLDGGICHYTYSLADALQSGGDTVTVLTYNHLPYELRGFPHRHTVRPTLRVSNRPLERLVNRYRNLATLLREAKGAEAVHFQWPLGPRTDPPLWNALKRAGKRVVYTAHNVVPHEAGNRAESHTDWLYTQADAIIVHGQKLKDLLLRQVSIAESRVNVIPLGNYNFIADQSHQWSRETARRSFGWGEAEQVVLFFGLIRPYKGLDTLIAACGEMGSVSGQNSRLRLLIAGPEINNSWTEGGYARQIQTAGLETQTTCAVDYIPLEEVARYFLAADIVALPYHSGSQSAVLQLAYAFARPVVTTDVGSIGDLAREAESGIVVPAQDSTALSKALLELQGNPLRATEMGRKGRCYAETALSWQRIAERTREVYRQAASR